MSAFEEGLIQTGGILPGFQDALRVAPGGFDPNYYKRTRISAPGVITQGTAGSDTLMTLSSGDDYLLGYGGGVGEVDQMFGYKGADTFILGDSVNGVYYAPVGGGAIIHDYNMQEGDIIHLSKLGQENYSVDYRDLDSNGRWDTIISYGNQPFAALLNTTDFAFTLSS